MTQQPRGILADPRARHAIAAVAIGLLAAAWVRSRALSQPAFTSDFDQVWAAARAWMEGRNPYEEIGPGARFEWKWPLYYPFPALLLASPLAMLPVVVARMIFAGFSAALFTYAIARDGWSRWPIFLSITFLVSVDLAQWSLIITAAYFLPQLGVVVAGKPNFALPLAASARQPRDLVWLFAGAALLVLVSLIARPSWPAEWIETVRTAPHFRSPILRPFGFLLALAVFKWRRPEARWLLGLSLIPQAPSFYDPVLLVVCCLLWWEAAVLAIGSWVLFFYIGSKGMQPDYEAWGTLVSNATVWFCYLPMLALVLRRPNEGVITDLSFFGLRRHRAP